MITKAKIRKHILSLGAFLLTPLLFPAPARVEEAGAQTGNVQIHNLTFTPKRLTVKAGTQVTFVNHDGILHSVIARGGQFDSGALDTDESFTFAFTAPGEFSHFCGLHSHMTATIVVEP